MTTEDGNVAKGFKFTIGSIGAIVLMALVVVGVVAVVNGNVPVSLWRVKPELGTPGGGYVRGAPKSAAECKKRGGVDLGRGCEGFD